MQNPSQTLSARNRTLNPLWIWSILGAIALVTWAAWPTSMWLLLCLFVAWMLDTFAAKLCDPGV